MNYLLSWNHPTFFALAEPSGPWSIVPNISDSWKLAAFALAVVLFIVMKSRGKKLSSVIWVVIVLLVAVPITASVFSEIVGRTDIYRLRVTVVDPQGVPIEDAHVWSSFGGEPKRVAGGWQFDISDANKPKDSTLTIYASKDIAFLTGQTNLTLGNDSNPTVTINLKRDNTAKVKGQVVDSRNLAVVGARVFVIGYESEAVVTKDGGNFDLPAHAAVGQKVTVHAEKKGYLGATRLQPAGDAVLILILKRQ